MANRQKVVETEHPDPPSSDIWPQQTDLFSEGLITLTEATRYCPRRQPGRKVHTTTVYRWATRGCRGVCLEVLDTPGGLCTTKAALRRFFLRLTSIRNLPQQVKHPPTSDEHERAIEAELKRRFGI
jgi:hypothetical protein